MEQYSEASVSEVPSKSTRTLLGVIRVVMALAPSILVWSNRSRI